MCRNIKQLRPSAGQPPASQEEIRLAALQYVRKVSGYRSPSKAKQAAFDLAVEQVAEATRLLLESLQTGPAPRSSPEWEEEDDLGFFYRAMW
jgi:hypothetical protein